MDATTRPTAPSDHDAFLKADIPEDGRASSTSPRARSPHLDIANFPSVELLRILAALLQHIATSNDQLRPLSHEAVQERAQYQQEPNTIPSFMYLPLNDPHRPTTTTAALATLNTPSSTLCFHARHIPSISIEAYLLRILKYCPTSNDVFLSLLVYFDRLSRVGALGHFPGEPPLDACDTSSSTPPSQGFTPPISMPWSNKQTNPRASQADANEPVRQGHGFPGISGFAIDSYNVHRLVIAGVTVASKFLSDVFYTNARYAKVGGLAVHELNQLELHFLLLTDFRLTIPLSEIQQYGDQLLAYAQERTVTANVPRPLHSANEEANNDHL
ncbi:cyclin-like protein interacting with PHO85 [Malassezia nana]|uniref:Cyclin-like protein interacting with PHO85 n=1 Tax=Malassezia nana TaxID=180528 RepID=A0AAF0ENQ9_9BASI|nr:cyclin-like protein interacting with PHO85 [Malassezia nana]